MAEKYVPHQPSGEQFLRRHRVSALGPGQPICNPACGDCEGHGAEKRRNEGEIVDEIIERLSNGAVTNHDSDNRGDGDASSRDRELLNAAAWGVFGDSLTERRAQFGVLFGESAKCLVLVHTRSSSVLSGS